MNTGNQNPRTSGLGVVNDTNTLAPCPFCGERAETDFIPEHHSYQIACSDSIGCTARITRDSELGAIEAWNCRAALITAAPQQAAQDALAYQAACSLATRLFKKHFSKNVEYASGKVTWGLCDTTVGVISQIVNMVFWLEPAAQAQPVATIYVTEDGSREVDDWKVELPVGATTLYTAAQAQPDDQQARGTDAAKPAAPAQAVAELGTSAFVGVEPVGEIRASSELGVAPYADIWAWLQPGCKLYTADQVKAADSVLEDAARWHWMAEYIVGTRTELDDDLIASATVDDLRKLVDADRAAHGQAPAPQPTAQALDALKQVCAIAVSAAKTNSRDIADWREDMDRIAAIAAQQGDAA